MTSRNPGISRRRLLQVSGAGAMVAASGTAQAMGRADPRLLLIIQRGGTDGLTFLPPVGDPDLVSVRPDLESAGTLPLDGFFALPSTMPTAAELWQRGELAGFHAISTPYRDRSHFDAQNVLESGLSRPEGAANGWLNRALALRPDSASRGLSVGTGTPLVMRGPAAVGSWAPSQLPVADPTLVDRLMPLWGSDPLLATMLAQGRDLQAMTGGMTGKRGGIAAVMAGLMDNVGQLMARPGGPRIVAMDSGGWDMHANLRFYMNLLTGDLDQGIANLRSQLGSVWSDTVVLIVSEFGRTVDPNGTGGADHGIGGAAMVLGGAVRGGRVFADWPGLRAADRIDNRDLRPTQDLRHVFADILGNHLGYSRAEISETILPGYVFPATRTELFRS